MGYDLVSVGYDLVSACLAWVMIWSLHIYCGWAMVWSQCRKCKHCGLDDDRLLSVVMVSVGNDVVSVGRRKQHCRL